MPEMALQDTLENIIYVIEFLQVLIKGLLLGYLKDNQ